MQNSLAGQDSCILRLKAGNFSLLLNLGVVWTRLSEAPKLPTFGHDTVIYDEADARLGHELQRILLGQASSKNERTHCSHKKLDAAISPMSPTNFAPRIGLAASTLLTAVAAHLAAANQLPPIGYLTLIDKIMIVVYALFLNNLLSMVVQMRLVDHKQEEKAIKINAKMRRLMPLIIGVILAVLVSFDLRLI